MAQPEPLVLNGEHVKLDFGRAGRAVADGQRLSRRCRNADHRPDCPSASRWKSSPRSRPPPTPRWKASTFRTACSAPSARRKAFAASPISSTGPTICPSSRRASRPTKRDYPVLLSNGNPHRERRSCRRPPFRGLARSLPQALLSVRAGGGRSRRRIAGQLHHHVGPQGALCASMSSMATSRAPPTPWTRSSAR